MGTLRHTDRTWWPSDFAHHALLGCLIVTLLAAGACNRARYRQQAEAEAFEITAEKTNDPRWALPRIGIEIDPDSRMYDPFDPDRPPMPPDDPTSHRLMHDIDGKRNYPHWHEDGNTVHVENPGWKDALPLDDRGVLKLDLSTAVHLGLKHAPDYQREFEDLFLSALDVSAERFRFDRQFFGGSNAFYRTSGKNSGFARSELRVDSDLALQKAYITGAELVVNFANSFVWNFHGPNSNNAFSLLDFSLVQPLLRGAGRDRVLTRLTLAERQLLGNIRQMERFRRGFYLELATGDGGTFGARRIGGLFGGSGLEGFTGVGGGFGGVGAFAGAGGAQAAGAALQVGGFFGLLQNRQNIRNQTANIAGLRANVTQFQQTLRESLRTVPDDPTEVVRNRLQFAQARQTLYNQEFALVSAQARYQSQVDDYKIDLGLPPDVCVEIDDPMLDQFNLLDPAVIPIQEQISNLSQVVGATNEQILADTGYETRGDRNVATVVWSPELARQLDQIDGYLTRIATVREQLFTENLVEAKADIAAMEQAMPRRRETLRRLRDKHPKVLEREHLQAIACQIRLPVDIDPYVLDVSRLDNFVDQLKTEYVRLETQLATYAEDLARIRAAIENLQTQQHQLDAADLYRTLEEEIVFAVPDVLSSLNSALLDLSLVQARARAESIDLIPIDLSMRDAVCIAAINRRDWMNARSSLVDTWRAIAFVANDLEGVLDIVVDGQLGTEGNNPLKFQSTNGSLRMGLEFDAPFTRLLERNNYRQVLIDYQQARRNYYQFVDRVTQELRNIIRTLDLNELNFETRRVAVLSAIEQVVLNDEIQTLNEERAQSQGVTAARDIVQALSDLQAAQDDFMGVWLTYEVNRRFLDFGLGTMELDESGMWLDPGAVVSGTFPYLCDPRCLPLLTPNVSAWLASEDHDLMDVSEQLTEAEATGANHSLRVITPKTPLPHDDVIELSPAAAIHAANDFDMSIFDHVPQLPPLPSPTTNSGAPSDSNLNSPATTSRLPLDLRHGRIVRTIKPN